MAPIADGRESRPARNGWQHRRREASFRVRMPSERERVRTKCGAGESADGCSSIGLESAERDLSLLAGAPTGLVLRSWLTQPLRAGLMNSAAAGCGRDCCSAFDQNAGYVIEIQASRDVTA